MADITDTRITPGQETRLIVTRVAETWQFFAFVFAALVTLALALLEEIPPDLRWWRIAAKLVVFLGLGYLLLLNVTVRGWLSTQLVGFKQERR